MDPLELKQWLNPSTFEPFEIQLSTGERLPVRHPEHLAVTKRASILLVYGKQDDLIASDHVLISNMHIVKLQHLNGVNSGKS
ncbi:MAG: hypothetical protein AMXMBFR47_33990 [Planctomycetota bacterium]